MKTIEEQFKKLKSITLTQEEKQKTREVLLSFIQKNPVRVDLPSRHTLQEAYTWSSFLQKFNHIRLHTMPLIIIIALLAGSGVSFAAEKTLPGDVLYPVKVNINEEVRGWLSVSSQGKAQWEATRAERRLEEAEKLTLEGKIDPQTNAKLQADFAVHAEAVQKHVSEIKSQKDFTTAAEVSSEFETSLRAHQGILVQIGEESQENKEEVKEIVTQIEAATRSTTEARTQAEAGIATEDKTYLKVSAEEKLKAAENSIAEVKRVIQRTKNEKGEEAVIGAEAEVEAAEAAVVEGKARFAAKAYTESFEIFQKAQQMAENSKLLIKAEQNLKIQLRVQPKINLQINEDSKTDQKDEVKPNSILKSEGQLKLQLGR